MLYMSTTLYEKLPRNRAQWDKMEKTGQKSENETQFSLFRVIVLETIYYALIVDERFFRNHLLL